MPTNDPTKQRVRDLQPTVSALVYLPIPSHKVSLTVPVPEYGAEECAAFQVILPYLTYPIILLLETRISQMYALRYTTDLVSCRLFIFHGKLPGTCKHVLS